MKLAMWARRLSDSLGTFFWISVGKSGGIDGLLLLIEIKLPKFEAIDDIQIFMSTTERLERLAIFEND